MLNLSFVQDEELRQSLVSDFSEIEKAYENQLWKSVHVLAGSIIEALLIETIASVDSSSNKDRLLRMHLSDLIPQAVTLGILSAREERLSSVVQEYRNLIHPGRVLRLQESIDRDTASIALSLIRVVSAKLETEQSKKIGYSADNIIIKMKNDNRFLSIIDNLLSKMNQKEKFKLATELIPQVILASVEAREEDKVSQYINVYNSLVSNFTQDEIERLEKMIVSDIETGQAGSLDFYFNYLFSIHTVNRFSNDSKDLVMKYALHRFENNARAFINAFEGISILERKYIEIFINAIIFNVVHLYSRNTITHAAKFIENEYYTRSNNSELLLEVYEEKYKAWDEMLEGYINQGKQQWQNKRDDLNFLYTEAVMLPF